MNDTAASITLMGKGRKTRQVGISKKLAGTLYRYIVHRHIEKYPERHMFSIAGRKNWFFADIPKGTKASSTVYSLNETAKANRLNVYTYLQYLLMYMLDSD